MRIDGAGASSSQRFARHASPGGSTTGGLKRVGRQNRKLAIIPAGVHEVRIDGRAGDGKSLSSEEAASPME